MTSIKTGDSMIVKYYVRMKTFLKTEVQFSHKIKEAILGVEFKELCQMYTPIQLPLQLRHSPVIFVMPFLV